MSFIAFIIIIIILLIFIIIPYLIKIFKDSLLILVNIINSFVMFPVSDILNVLLQGQLTRKQFFKIRLILTCFCLFVSAGSLNCDECNLILTHTVTIYEMN